MIFFDHLDHVGWKERGLCVLGGTAASEGMGELNKGRDVEAN